MSKRSKIILIVGIYLISMLTVGISMTYLTDYLKEINWFGDYSETKYSHYFERQETYYYWGVRHYWYNWGYFFCSVFTFIIMASKVIKIAEDE